MAVSCPSRPAALASSPACNVERGSRIDPPPQALQHLADRATGAGLAVLGPYAAEWMEAHAVSPRINSLKHNDAALIQRVS